MPVQRLKCQFFSRLRYLSAKVDLLGGDAEEGPGPGPAPLEVLDHLDLVDDGDLVGLVEVGHLDGARHVLGRLLLGPGVLPLFASHLTIGRT